MTRRIALLVMVLSLMVPVVATADIIVNNVDFYAVYNTPPPHTPANDGWTVLKNKYGYGDPFWEAEPLQYNQLAIDNIYVPTLTKWVWLEIDYVQLPSQLPTLSIQGHTPSGNAVVTAYPPAINGDNVTWLWKLVPQPGEEKILFPDTSFFNLIGISQIEIGTLCVPLPNTAWMGLSAMCCLMAFYGWRKARSA